MPPRTCAGSDLLTPDLGIPLSGPTRDHHFVSFVIYDVTLKIHRKSLKMMLFPQTAQWERPFLGKTALFQGASDLCIMHCHYVLPLQSRRPSSPPTASPSLYQFFRFIFVHYLRKCHIQCTILNKHFNLHPEFFSKFFSSMTCSPLVPKRQLFR